MRKSQSRYYFKRTTFSPGFGIFGEMGPGNEIRDCRGKQDVGLGSRNLRIKLGGFREISITYHLVLYKERSSWSLFEGSFFPCATVF